MSGENDYREKGRALFLAAIMVVSVFGMTAAFGGSAAAAHGDNTTLIVDGDGTDGPNHYATIEAAVGNASDGDTIEVESGNYGPFSVTTNNVTITAVGSQANTVINISDGESINLGGTTETEITGFTIQFAHRGIYPSGSNNLISKNKFETTDDSVEYAIRSEGGETGTAIRDNDFVGINESDDTGSAIVIGEPNGQEITGNNFTNSDFGINVGNKKAAQSLLIQNNNFNGDSVGIILNHDDSGAPEFSISQNNFDSTAIGIYALKGGEIDATENWWGSANGPNTTDNSLSTSGASISGTAAGNVEFSPWLDASTENGGEAFAPVTNDSGGQFTTIQGAVDAAEDGDTIEVAPGTYNEGVTIDTANVTLESTAGADETTISADATEGVMIKASDVTVRGFTVTTNLDDTDTHGQYGIRLEPDSGVENILIEDNIVQDISDAYRPAGVSLDMKTAGTNTAENVTVRDNIIRNITSVQSQEYDAFAKGINANERFDNLTIVNNTIQNIGDEHSTGANGIDLSSDGDVNPAVGPENFTIRQNDVDGLTVDDESYEAAYLDANALYIHTYADFGEEHIVTQNNFRDGRVYRNTDGVTNPDTLSAHLNWWGDDSGPGGVAGGNGSAVSEEVTYNPFLTVPADEVADDSAEITQFGFSDQIPSDGSAWAPAIPGPTDRTAGEMFNMDQFNGTVYRYDAENDQWELVSSDDEVNALDAFVVIPDEGETAHVTWSFAEAEGDTPTAPGDADVEQGWNLVGAPQNGSIEAAFAASSAEPARALNSFGPSDSDDFSSYTFGTEDVGPTVHPFKGYWIYANEDGSIAVNLGAGESTEDVNEKLDEG